MRPSSTCRHCGVGVVKSITWMHTDSPPDWPHAFFNHSAEPKEDGS